MGTALTNNHIKLLKKLNIRIILCMDNDSAGEEATINNGEAMQEAGIETYVVRLTGEKDPDEYILKNGVEAYQDALNHADTYFDFKLKYYQKNKNLNKAEDQAQYINSVLQELNKQNDPILIETTINSLSKEYNIPKTELQNKIIKVAPVKQRETVRITRRRLNQKQKYQETLLFYMMSDENYVKLYEQELSYMPDDKYMKIADDILAFYIKYNYISVSDFITFEIESPSYEDVLAIVENNADLKLIGSDFLGLLTKIKESTFEDKIASLKEKLKTISDINEKVKITSEIAELKKKVCKE
jgi:DNA primase